MFRLVLSLGVVPAALVAVAVAQAPSFERVATETVVVAKIGDYKQGTITVTADGRRFAYGKEQSWGFEVEVDGKPQGIYDALGPVVWGQPNVQEILNAYAHWGLDEFPGIKPMIFSGDGQHLAFGAKVKDSWLIVHDRRKGKPFKSVGGPVLTHDGQHLAYAAKVEDGWCVVRDGAEGKTYKKVGPPVFSADGAHLAHAAQLGERELIVVDGVEAKSYDNLDIPHSLPPPTWGLPVAFSLASSLGIARLHAFRNMVAAFPAFGADGRLCYPAERDGKWFVVVDGQEGEPFEKVSSLTLSPDGKHVAYAGRVGDQWTVVLDGRRVGAHMAVSSLALSRDGNRLAYAAQAGDDWKMVIDGKAQAAYKDLGPPVFSPDGTRVAYRAKTGDGWVVVVDGKAQQPCKDLRDPAFSPDGSTVAYAASRGGDRWAVVLNGVEGKEYRAKGLVRGTKIVFDDNLRFRYLLVTKDYGILRVEEMLKPLT